MYPGTTTHEIVHKRYSTKRTPSKGGYLQLDDKDGCARFSQVAEMRSSQADREAHDLDRLVEL